MVLFHWVSMMVSCKHKLKSVWSLFTRIQPACFMASIMPSSPRDLFAVIPLGNGRNIRHLVRTLIDYYVPCEFSVLCLYLLL